MKLQEYKVPSHLTVEKVRSITAAVFGITPEAILIRRKKRVLTTPRQFGMLITHCLLAVKLKDTAKEWNLVNHATVLHGCRNAKNLYYSSPQFRRNADRVFTELGLQVQETRIMLELETMEGRR